MAHGADVRHTRGATAAPLAFFGGAAASASKAPMTCRPSLANGSSGDVGEAKFCSAFVHMFVPALKNTMGYFLVARSAISLFRSAPSLLTFSFTPTLPSWSVTACAMCRCR